MHFSKLVPKCLPLVTEVLECLVPERLHGGHCYSDAGWQSMGQVARNFPPASNDMFNATAMLNRQNNTHTQL